MVRSKSKRFSRLGVQRQTPEATKALLAKLTRDPSGPKQKAGEQVKLNVPRNLFERISKETGQKSLNIEGIYQLLPDIELAEQVLVGSILSPKDLSTADLGFSISDGEFHSEVAGPFLNIIKNHFKVEYKIDEQLDQILTEILFTKGAYILAVLPENNLDEIINSGSMHVSNEAFTQAISYFQAGRPMGFLGEPSKEKVSLEGFGTQPSGKSDNIQKIFNLSITDNFDVLKVPQAKNVLRSRRIAQTIRSHQRGTSGIGLESLGKGLSPEDIDKLYDKEFQTTPTQTVVPQEYMKRPPVGHPLVLNLPTESVIPVYSPGNPSDHVGYFVILDEHSKPVVRNDSRDYYNEMRTSFQTGKDDSAGDIVKLAKEAFGGVSRDRGSEYESIHEAYTTIVENDLINRLRNGLYQEEFSIGLTESITEIMLYRSLKAQRTQLLYIPEELVVYMAYDFNPSGVGQSLITRTEILASMRSVLLFADTMSGVRNAIGRKRVNITTDPDSLDPEKDISDIQNLILESSARGFPLASPDPGQTLDYLNRAGYDFQIDVQGDNYPTTKVEYDDYNSNVQAGNPELEDRLRRMQISSFGLNPEQVDPTQSPDFATSVVNNNLMLARRVKRQQKKLCSWISKFVQLYVSHSSILLEELKSTLEDHRSKLTPEQRREFGEDGDASGIIEDFIRAIEVSLPSPDTTREDQQLQAMEQHRQLLDSALNDYITEDLISPELMAIDPDALRHVIATVRSYHMRMWMERNNILPELQALTEMEGPTKPAFNLLDIQGTMWSSLGKALHKYLKKIERDRAKWESKQAGSEGEVQDDDFTTDEPEEDTTDDFDFEEEEGPTEEEDPETPEEIEADVEDEMPEETPDEEGGDQEDDSEETR